MTWKQTHSGKAVDLITPDPDTIVFEDIAHSLAHQCRFTGHTKRHYSVAQHSILASRFVTNKRHQLAALFHDASEAYLADIATPVKQMLPDYYLLEFNMMVVIARKFGFEFPFADEIKTVDARLLMTEQEQLIGPQVKPWEIDAAPYSSYRITYMSPARAKNAFYTRARQLGLDV
jgi:uncharacterized protein